jgi:hypothetical protein
MQLAVAVHFSANFFSGDFNDVYAKFLAASHSTAKISATTHCRLAATQKYPEGLPSAIAPTYRARRLAN